jgi:hypothetical protein
MIQYSACAVAVVFAITSDCSLSPRSHINASVAAAVQPPCHEPQPLPKPEMVDVKADQFALPY